MAEKSAIQRIKELDSERANILAQAKEEALVKANQAIEELNALGFSYQLTNGAQKVKGKIAKEGASPHSLSFCQKRPLVKHPI